MVILSTTLPHSCGKRREPTQRFPATRYYLRTPPPGNQNWWRWPRDSLRSRLSDIAKRWDQFDEPARKHVAVEEPKESELFRCSHPLATTALRSRAGWRLMRKTNHSGTEIWRACQR